MSTAVKVTQGGGAARLARSPDTGDKSARSLISKADTILKATDESYVFTTIPRRHFPTFSKSEIEIGPILGTGGFCVVREITALKLERRHDTTTTAASNTERNENHEPNDEKQENRESQAANQDNTETLTTSPVKEDNQKKQEDSTVHDEQHPLADDDHYAIETARERMVQRCHCNGNARYAIKRLRRDLSSTELARAMIDLAIEAKFLSALWHPNIVKMRGLAKEEALMTIDYFIVMDRLYGTLDEKLHRWMVASSKVGGLFGIGRNKMMIQDLMVERLLVAYDLAAALRYVHEQRLVYRDIKPENIGFDIRGDVKVFDFGLCKSLEPHLKVRGGYLLTGRTGSIPYMAPEVALNKPYDSKCDVFSYSILLWEILAIKPSFKGFTKKDFFNRVVMNSERLPIHKSWPPLTRAMMKAAWDPEPSKRPDMKGIATLIRTDLNDMSKDDTVLHRTQHMADRSQHSLSGRSSAPPDVKAAFQAKSR